jgi:hypothetical protein
MRYVLCCSILATVLSGCASDEPVDTEGKLLTMAAAEAQQIPDPTPRLTRQLNFADRQMNEAKFDEARQSLAYAAQTLREAKPAGLKSQIRIAGWVSISELSRAAKDNATAQIACDQAVNILKTLDPVAERPEYVVGVSDEVKALKGKAAAAALLESSIDWIKQMPGASVNRYALVAVSEAIFRCGDFTGGLAALRADSDAAWRSDTLAMIADRNKTPAPAGIFDTVGGVGGLVARAVPQKSLGDPSEMFPDSNRPFGKPVDFQSVFKNRQTTGQEQQQSK